MSFWTRGGSLILDAAGQAILCDDCPCEESPPSIQTDCCVPPISQNLVGFISNVTNCGAVTAGSYDLVYAGDDAPSDIAGTLTYSHSWLMYFSNDFRLRIACAYEASGETEADKKWKAWLECQDEFGVWRGTFGDNQPFAEDANSLNCDPLEIVFINIRDNGINNFSKYCCGQGVQGSMDLEVTE